MTAVAVDWVSNTVPLRIRGASLADRVQPSPGPRVGLVAQVEVTPSAPGDERLQMRAALSLPADEVASAAGADPSWFGHVVLIAADEAPRVVPVRVPALRIADAAATPRYQASFQLDLRAEAPDLSGDWQVYLDAGTRWFGPWPVQGGPRKPRIVHEQ